MAASCFRRRLIAQAWDTYAQRAEARDAYYAALYEDKVGGTPVPTINDVQTLVAFSANWRLLLHPNTKDNEGNSDPFFLNLADDGVGYAFLWPDGHKGTFLWSRGVAQHLSIASHVEFRNRFYALGCGRSALAKPPLTQRVTRGRTSLQGLHYVK